MDQHDPAAARYFILQLIRIAGVAAAIFGAMIVAGRIEQPELLGAALLVAGMAGFFFVPAMLARRWKSGR